MLHYVVLKKTEGQKYHHHHLHLSLLKIHLHLN
jgi:hypothetical protein